MVIGFYLRPDLGFELSITEHVGAFVSRFSNRLERWRGKKPPRVAPSLDQALKVMVIRKQRQVDDRPNRWIQR